MQQTKIITISASCGGSGCVAPHEKILPKLIKIVAPQPIKKAV